MEFSIKDFCSKCEQIRSFLRIWSYLLKKSLVENLIFWAVFQAEVIDFHKRFETEIKDRVAFEKNAKFVLLFYL